MIDLSKSVIGSYKEKVREIYKKLEQDGWSNLKLFEFRYRKIHLLNSKIKNRSTDFHKSEDEYSNDII